MPTENRSSNTEMVSVPRELAEDINSALYDHDLNGLTVRLQELLDRPEQHRGNPVLLPMRRSWSGIAGWRDQAEIKAWNACLDEIAKLGPLYTHAHVCEKCRGVHCSKTVCALEIAGERDSLRAQLAERDALLFRMAYYLAPALEANAPYMSAETMHDALSALNEHRKLLAAARSSNTGPVDPEDRKFGSMTARFAVEAMGALTKS